MPSAYTFIKELIFLGIKIGETATVRLDVDVQYRCSSCDADILTTGTVRAVAQTGAIMGVNLDSNLTGNAKKALVEKLAALSNENTPHRFRTAGLNCSCPNCGHKEAWAKMNYEKLEKPSAISGGILIASLLILLYGLSAHPFNSLHLAFLLVSVVSALIFIGIKTYITKNNEKQEQLIANMPAENLPTIHL